MPEPTDPTAKLQTERNRRGLHELLVHLEQALGGIAAQLDKSREAAQQAREVGALYALWREAKGMSAADAAEPYARMKAALDGYPGEYLAWLNRFAGWLKTESAMAIRRQVNNGDAA